MPEALDKAFDMSAIARGTTSGGELTKGERRWAAWLRVLPWLSFFLVMLPLPALFFALSMLWNDPVWMLFALLGLGVGAVAGLITTILLLLYRRKWRRRVRQKLAADGIKANEVDWFLDELTPHEAKALKAMSAQDPLLADAYRETLAMRLTASHVVNRSKQDLRNVESRLNKLNYVTGSDTAPLRTELTSDRERFAQMLAAGNNHLGQAQLRLQTIEAAAQRGANWTETSRALDRLSVSTAQVPLALELAQIEEENRREMARALTEAKPNY